MQHMAYIIIHISSAQEAILIQKGRLAKACDFLHRHARLYTCFLGSSTAKVATVVGTFQGSCHVGLIRLSFCGGSSCFTVRETT